MTNSEAQNQGGEPTLRRTREPTAAPPEPRSRKVSRHLASSRWFGPVVMVILAVGSGFLVAPDLLERNYPTDAGYIGTPATENIKAPHDLDVADEKTTARLRDDALSQVRRVYDLDGLAAEKIEARVDEAFARARSDLESRLPELPNRGAAAAGARAPVAPTGGEENPAGGPAPPMLIAGLRPTLERALGTKVSDAELALLAERHFPEALARLIGTVVSQALARPMIAEQESLEPDRAVGITVQRIPADATADREIPDVSSIQEVTQVRAKVRVRLLDALERDSVGLKATQRDLLADLAARLVRPNLTLNLAETELSRTEARLAVTPAKITIKKGEMIIRDGERLTERHLLILRALGQSRRQTSLVLVALGAALLVGIVIVTGLRIAFVRTPRAATLTPRDTVFLAALFLVALGGARVWFLVSHALEARFAWPLITFLFALPVAGGAMVARLVLRAEAALLFALTSSLAAGMMMHGERMFALYAFVGAVLGGTAVGTMRERSDLLRAGLWVGLGQAAMACGVLLFDADAALSTYAVSVPAAFLSGAIAPLVALALAPAVEAIFGYTTDLKLLELANLSHPALKELIVQAPGSYHHSIIVGSLVEAAAEAIGANSLLARVMAYYHDIGKGCNPAYFIENQRLSQNPHDKLKPSMSAMIIRRHVTEGLELAQRHRLGEQIMAGIIEHHGTTLIHYFFHKAKEQSDEDTPISENDYRYPGRKPQTREAALVMLADSVEAASRSLPEPTQARLRGLVTRVINLKFGDGQLEECDLTLRDLHTIAKAFSRVLDSIYHERIEYPELLKDLTGTARKQLQAADADLRLRVNKPPDANDEPPPDVGRPDNLRRLGLS